MEENIFLSNDEIKTLIKEHQDKKKDNSVILITNYRNLIYKYILPFTKNKKLERDDLIQEANMALMQAINKYDINSEYKFMTFASSYIKCNLLTYSNKQNDIYMPRNIKIKINKYLKEINNLSLQLGHQPSHEEILELTDYDINDIKFLSNSNFLTTSMDVAISEKKPGKLMDYIVDPEVNIQETYEDETIQNNITNLINTMLDSNLLTATQKDVLILRHGLYGNDTHSLRAIGAKLNLSHQTIAVLLTESYAKIHKSSYITKFSELTDFTLKKQQN